jgi:miniconductance mechanosensitive channel
VETLTQWLLSSGLPPAAAEAITLLSGIAAIAVLAFIANLIAKKVIVRSLNAMITRWRLKYFLLLQEHRVLTKLSHVAPAIIIQSLAPTLFAGWSSLADFARMGVSVYLIGVGVIVIDALLNVLLTAYNRLGPSQRMPIKGFIQAVKLVVFLIGLILIVSVFLDKSPLLLMSGLGALTAVLLLVFRDAILGFVAGIQLSANNMVQTGDWIEMPKQGADGDVIDVSLTTVKVQNWDRTITTIPSYLLISDSFRNWRGMVESGGRRIKRSIHLDMRTIRFLDPELLNRCKKIQLLRPYLDRALEEIQKHNSESKLEMNDLLNGRHLTNIGTFRAYCVAYLRQHAKVHQEMIQIVRQLEPGPTGLPLEIYLFTNDINWVAYEGIQADIFDHLLAIVPHFGLRVFQQPSGGDIADLGGILAPANLASAPAIESAPGSASIRN